jgi:hypothetical protein
MKLPVFSKRDQQETALNHLLLLKAIFSKTASETGVNSLLFVPEKSKLLTKCVKELKGANYLHLLPFQ